MKRISLIALFLVLCLAAGLLLSGDRLGTILDTTLRSGEMDLSEDLSVQQEGSRIGDDESDDGDVLRERRVGEEGNSEGAAEHGGCLLPCLGDEAVLRHGTDQRSLRATGAATA